MGNRMHRYLSTYLRLLFVCVAIVVTTGTLCIAAATQNDESDRPNVVFIICDDLNDYIEGFRGHHKQSRRIWHGSLHLVCDLPKHTAIFQSVVRLELAFSLESIHTTQAVTDLRNGTHMRFSRALERLWTIFD